MNMSDLVCVVNGARRPVSITLAQHDFVQLKEYFSGQMTPSNPGEDATPRVLGVPIIVADVRKSYATSDDPEYGPIFQFI